MTRVELTHNPSNGVTRDVWLEDDVVHKVLTRRDAGAPAHWRASDDVRHWNYWRREADVYESDLPGRLGLGAPRLIAIDERPDGDVELRLERVVGRGGAALDVDDLEAAAGALGLAQGGARRPLDTTLSRGFLRAYSRSRPAAWALIDDDRAWQQPLVARHFSPELRDGLRRLHAASGPLIDAIEAAPRAVCHLDVWPNNIIRRPTGEIVLLDWAFCGDGALGEDVGNLIPDAIFDLLLDSSLLAELDERLAASYLAGLRQAGWAGDARLVRLGICASAVKYDWLIAHCLEHASQELHTDYGRRATVDPDVRYAARAAGLALCARWASEAIDLLDRGVGRR